MKKVSIIVPCHNEEANINEFIKAINHELFEINVILEIIFINDGSQDQTINKIKALMTSDDRIKAIDFSRNFGKEAAVLAGMDYCQGDAAVVIDADLQIPIRYIKILIELWLEGNKLVLTYKSKRERGIKSSLASKYYDVYNAISDYKILNDALDFQIMDREVIDVICSMRERERFFKGLTGFIGYNYKIIPVDIEQRVAGSSDFSNINKLFNYAFKSIAIHSDIPLRISTRLGIIVSLVGFIYMLYIILSTFIKGVSAPGYASIIVIMLFMFGIVLLILGIIGYYLGLIYNEVKNRPNYIVNDFFDNNKDDL
ncbi:MAG: glycosyltransferase family 2 protein [Bacilli bacterium]|jgi:glycosyltransferase involved in cell wall biosynthesis|nr:glycosyltransferase family 2 protein [Bacilli bacterium]